VDSGGLVALFGRRVDPKSPFLREWDAIKVNEDLWLGSLPGAPGHWRFPTWRDALAAVRAAEEDGRC
jgi:hypothetical protein